MSEEDKTFYGQSNILSHSAKYTIEPVNDLDEVHGSPSSPYFLRLGDVQFMIPPTSIRTDKVSKTQKSKTLRGKGSVKYGGGQSTTRLTIDIYFNNINSINGYEIGNPMAASDAVRDEDRFYYIDGLRSLIAQFNNAPFLPIENEFINNVLGIDAVTLQGLEVNTIEGFPNTLKCQLTMYEFNYRTYLPWIDEVIQIDTMNIFKHAFNWPLFRYYYQKNIDDYKKIEKAEIDDSITFSKISEQALKERREARTKLKEDKDKYNKKFSEIAKEMGKKNSELVEARDKYFDAKKEFLHIYKTYDNIEYLTARDMMSALGNSMPENILTTGDDKGGALIKTPSKKVLETAAENNRLRRREYNEIIIYFEGHPKHNEDDKVLIELLENIERKDIEAEALKRSNELQNDKVKYEALASKDEGDMEMEEIPLDDLYLKRLNIKQENIVSEIRLDGQTEPAHQYFGSQDVLGYAEFQATSRETVAIFKNMLDETNAKIQAYRDEIMPGFLKVDNDLLNLFGVENIVIEACTISTTNNPEVFSINLTFYEFDINQKDKESLDKTSGNTEETYKRPDKEDLEINTAVQSIRNQLLLKKRLMEKSPFPDLNLPTIKEFKDVLNRHPKNLGTVHREIEGNYVDPDFYIMTLADLKDYILKSINSEGKILMRDNYGQQTEYDIPNGKNSGSMYIEQGSQSTYEKIIEEAQKEDESYKKLNDFPVTEDDEHGTKMVSPLFNGNTHSINIKGKNIPSVNDRLYGMLHDLMKYSHQGRLSRAFPSFHISFIEEGEEMDNYRLWDNLYGINGITSIDIVRSRKQAADICYLEISNIYDNLYSDTTEDVDLDADEEYSWWNYFSDDMSIEMIEDHMEVKDRLNILPGARIQVRNGYGSNLESMPLVFNGTIAEINATRKVQIVAQSDGAELTNVIPADKDDSTGRLDFGVEPQDIIMEILKEEQSLIKEGINKITLGKFMEQKHLGIKHFGQKRHVWKEAQTQNFLNKNMKFYYGSDDSEIGINVYPALPEPSENEDHKLVSLARTFLLGQPTTDEPNMSFYLFNQTPWDIFNKLALAVEDFVVSAQPFEMRSTLYYGKYDWPFTYGYGYDGDWVSINSVSDINTNKILPKRKTFQQAHFISSDLDIIHNGIKASSKDVYTYAIPTFKDDSFFTLGPESESAMKVFADTDIDEQYQRLLNVETGILHKGILPYFSTDKIAENMAACSLRDSLKDMYKGQITIIGDSSIKPHDYIYLNDSYNFMNGPVLAEQVVHHMSIDTGFITNITPDAVSHVSPSSIKPYTMLDGIFGVTGVMTTMAALRAVLRVTDPASIAERFSRLKKGLGSSGTVKSALGITNSVGRKVKEAIEAAGGKLSGSEIVESINKSFADEILQAAEEGTDLHKVGLDLKKGLINVKEAGVKVAEFAEDMDDLRHIKNFSYAAENLSKVTSKAGDVADGAADAARITKSLFKGFKSSTKVAKALKYIGTFGIMILVEGMQDLFFRWAKNRQRCIIIPLKKNGKEFSAGIKGHQGMVWGEPKSIWDKAVSITGKAMALPPFFNLKGWTNDYYSPGNTEDDKDISDMFGAIKEFFRDDKKTGGYYDPPKEDGIVPMRRDSYFDSVKEKQDKEAEGFALHDYEEVRTGNFYQFENVSNKKVTARMIEVMDRLQSELRHLGIDEVTIDAVNTDDLSSKIGHDPSVSVDDSEEPNYTRGSIIGERPASRNKVNTHIIGPHKTGQAIDIKYSTEEEKERLIRAIENTGIGRKGKKVGSYFINEQEGYIQIDSTGLSEKGKIINNDIISGG
jgi:hypothetical protein